jgi:uncharacterized protein (DUF1330 family)
MSTYLINHVRLPDGIRDQEGPTYLEQAKSIVELYGGRWLAPPQKSQMEGVPADTAVLVEFASIMEAQNWYNSSEYQNIAHLCPDNAIDLILVDGVSPDFTMAGFAPRSGSLSPKS